MAHLAHPPKPRAALSVGIIGHRPNRIPEEIRARIEREVEEILAAIRNEAIAAHARHSRWFADLSPRLAIVTALAEGADRMAVETGLESSFELEAPLPFPADGYEEDFETRDSKDLFRSLLRQSRAILELEGDRRQVGKSYAAAGLVVLDNADVLVAVWDGGVADGRGGTAELIAEAARRGMPVIRVDVTGNRPPQLHWRGFDDRHTTPVHIDDHPARMLDTSLAAVIDEQIRPPQNPEERQGLEWFFAERSRRLTARFEYPLLMLMFGVRWPRIADIVLPRPEPAEDDPEASAFDAGPIKRAFGWADAIGLRFAQDFRSAVVTNFLVAALAVLIGALNLSYPWSAIELGLVLLLVLNAFIGQARRWHHRWIESREVAERLRVAAAMRALATRAIGPFGAAPTWPAWYVRAIAREAGLRSGRLDRDGLATARRKLLSLLRGQAAYHDATSRRFMRLHNRLALAGQVLFVAALLLSASMFAVRAFHLFPVTWGISYWLIVATASLPAFGSASYGIRVIGDFEGAARRSARMKEQLDGLVATIENGSASLEWLRDRVHKTSDVILGDVANWRLVVESRELSMPG